jgi:anti-anti-sigma factor
VKVSGDARARILTLPAELGAETEAALIAALDQALEGDPAAVVVDLSPVFRANSAGVGALVVLLGRAKEKKVPVALAGARGILATMLERAGLAGHAAVFDSVEAALRMPPLR